jgi:predicted metal-dependent enzyme (double-stranded beta helix superfamily)
MLQNVPTTFPDGQCTGSAQAIPPLLSDLVAEVRAAVSMGGDWEQTSQFVASVLRHHLPSPDVLTADQRLGDPDRYCTRLLYTEPNGNFSIVALVLRPGQETPIHDHVTWCVFGVIQGVEYEELFIHNKQDSCLVRKGSNINVTGEVSGFAPPGDIHRVGNTGACSAISIHIYGTDISRIPSSVRHIYELPIHPD